jgi:hypothetical protein
MDGQTSALTGFHDAVISLDQKDDSLFQLFEELVLPLPSVALLAHEVPAWGFKQGIKNPVLSWGWIIHMCITIAYPLSSLGQSLSTSSLTAEVVSD